MIYKQFKRNTALGLIPPVKVEYDKAQGFVVEALEDIKDKTLLVEYAGAVTRIVDSGQTDSDSLMVLLETSSPKTSLIIDPSKSGNMARFLSGVNNSDHESKKNADNDQHPREGVPHGPAAHLQDHEGRAQVRGALLAARD